MLPFRWNAVAAIGPGLGSNVFSRVLLCLPQKLIVPPEPAVENVPCKGWKLIALTEKSCCGSRGTGASFLWHLKEKLRLQKTMSARDRGELRSNITYFLFSSLMY